MTVVTLNGLQYETQNAGKTWSYAQNGSSLRFEVRSGDVWSIDAGLNKERSEVYGYTKYNMGTEIHVSYDWTIESTAALAASWCDTGQFHQTANDGKSPPFAIMFYGNQKMVVLIGVDGGYQRIYTDANDIQHGHLYKMKIDIRFAADSTGYCKVTRDGVVLCDYHGHVGWSGMSSVYWKMGIYRASTAATWVLSYGNLAITTGAVATSPPPVSPPPVSPPPPPPPTTGTQKVKITYQVSASVPSPVVTVPPPVVTAGTPTATATSVTIPAPTWTQGQPVVEQGPIAVTTKPVIDLTEFGVKAAEYSTKVVLTDVSGGVQIAVGTYSVVLGGWTKAQLSASNFVFAP